MKAREPAMAHAQPSCAEADATLGSRTRSAMLMHERRELGSTHGEPC